MYLAAKNGHDKVISHLIEHGGRKVSIPPLQVSILCLHFYMLTKCKDYTT